MLTKIFNQINSYRKELLLSVIVLISLLGLAGWILGILPLTGGFYGYKTMALSSAIFFIMLAIALHIHNKKANSAKWIVPALTGFLLLGSVYIFLQSYFAIPTDVEQIFGRITEKFDNIGKGRMSPVTSILFTTSVLSCFLQLSKKPIIQNAGTAIILLTGAYSFLLIMGYTCGMPFLYGGKYIPVSLPSSACFVFLCAAIIETFKINIIPLRFLKHSDLSKRLTKAFLPACVLIIVLHGFVEANITQITGNRVIGTFVLLVITISILAIIILSISRQLGNSIEKIENEKMAIQYEKEAEIKKQNEEFYTLYEEYKTINDELNIKNTTLSDLNHQLIESENRTIKSSQLLLDIIDNMPALIYTCDPDGRILLVNKALCNLFHATRHELIGKTRYDFLPPSQAQAHRRNEIEVFDQKRTLVFEESIDQIDGQHTYYSIKFPLANAEGKVYSVCGISIDITNRKAIEDQLTRAKEKAEESDKLKTAFLQNMSHEIRTPMNAIMGFSELLPEQFHDREKLLYFSSIINRRCSDLLAIINDILDISKIESGQVSVFLEPLDLNKLFNELYDLFKDQNIKISKENIQFLINKEINPEQSVVITDPVKVKQVFINLINNAFKFTQNGIIETGCYYDEEGSLVFFVSDTGIGIPHDKQSAIFERFTQLNNDITNGAGGTGLGLAIVKGLIEILNGEIWLDSEPDKGSRFYFRIPLQFSNSETPVDSEYNQQGNIFPISSKTLLIVEDDTYNLQYLKEIMAYTGFAVLTSQYGENAIQIAKNKHIDIVLMDIRLPDIDGYEVTRQIKKIKPRIKIIAQTAYATEADKLKALDSGCDGFISKPITRKKLFSAIENQLIGMKL